MNDADCLEDSAVNDGDEWEDYLPEDFEDFEELETIDEGDADGAEDHSVLDDEPVQLLPKAAVGQQEALQVLAQHEAEEGLAATVLTALLLPGVRCDGDRLGSALSREGPAALKQRVEALAAAAGCSEVRACGALLSHPPLATVPPAEYSTRFQALSRLLQPLAPPQVANVALGNGALLAAPPGALAAKLRILAAATGLPAREAAKLVTIYMF